MSAKKDKRRVPPLESLLTVKDFEKAAKAALSKPARDYYRSGADAERTLGANVDAFARRSLWYKVLVDVSQRELATTVLGTPVTMPILVAPTAYHCMAHPDGEAATARATSVVGTLMVVSTLATMSLESVAQASSGPKWFQLYVHKDRVFTEELVARAGEAGYRAIVLTVDTPILGRRLRDVRNRFALPEGLTMANLVSASEPLPADNSQLAAYVAARHDASLTWADVDWLAARTKLPVVLKGIVRQDDARRAVEHGAAGVIVSNHGARQLDHAPATLDALPGVVEACKSSAEVYLDGGVRWGTDVLKALAMGARAVLLGRPVLWGLAIAGDRGVERVLELLREELSNAMALAGVPSVNDVDRSLVGG